MNIREIFQETRAVIKKNNTFFLGYTMATFAVFFALTVAYIFSGIDWSILVVALTIALIMPLFVGIDFIAKKAVNSEELEYRDFYLGHRNFLTSLTLETKVLSRGLLFSVLGSLGTTFILNLIVTYYIALENPEIMKLIQEVAIGSAPFSDLFNAYSAIGWYETSIIIIDVISLLMGGIFYIWQGKRYSFLPYICFETRFNLPTAVYLAKESSDSIQKPFFAYNLLYLLVAVLIAGLSVGSFYLANIALNETISLVISFGVGSLLAAPVFLQYKVSLYVIYAKNFKARIDETFKVKLEEAKQKHNQI